MTIKEFIEDADVNDVLIPDGFDAAFMGLAEVNGATVAVYDELEMINILRKDGMSYSEAREYFDFNILGSSQEGVTPIYVNRYTQNLTSKIENAD